MSPRTRWHEDRGVAMIYVLGLSMVVMLIGILLTQLSVREVQQAGFQENEDVSLAGTEAMLERYAAKLTLDPLYYLHRVDEAERARVCGTGASLGVVVEPGNTWDDSCNVWTYQDPASGEWFVHPLFDYDGDPTTLGNDDLAVLMEITPPSAGQPLRVGVVGRRGDSINRRMVEATINAVALSEFTRVTQDDLSFGSGANILGPTYSGGDLGLSGDTNVYFNVYAEGRVTGGSPSRYYDGAKKYDSTFPVGSEQNIRTAISEPLNFDNFWDDLDIIRNVACTPAPIGYCLNDSDATAWLVQPYLSGGIGKVRVWKTTFNPSPVGTVDSTEYWYFNGESRMAQDGRPTSGSNGSKFWGPANFDNATRWTPWKPAGAPSFELEIPSAGVIWASNNVVLGLRGSMSGTTYGSDRDSDGNIEAEVDGALTVVAGSAANTANLILNSDVFLANDASVLGLAASNVIVYNPFAVSTTSGNGYSRPTMYVQAAYLGQGGGAQDSNFVARSDGRGGSRLTPSNADLIFWGARASDHSDDMAASFNRRFYNFDPRLEFMRPPFYPLLDNKWTYSDWLENPLPAWARG